MPTAQVPKVRGLSLVTAKHGKRAEAGWRARSQVEKSQGTERPELVWVLLPPTGREGRNIYVDTKHVKNYGWGGVREEGSESGAKLFKE